MWYILQSGAGSVVGSVVILPQEQEGAK